MRISSDEARALAFIAALIGFTLLGRWVDRPRPLGAGEPEVNIEEVAARSEAALARREGRAAGSGGGSGSGSGSGGGNNELVDLNRASAAELERLPGIGPALAGRIVAYRDSVGAFRAVEELDSVRGIGPAMLGRLKPLLRL